MVRKGSSVRVRQRAWEGCFVGVGFGRATDHAPVGGGAVWKLFGNLVLDGVAVCEAPRCSLTSLLGALGRPLSQNPSSVPAIPSRTGEQRPGGSSGRTPLEAPGTRVGPAAMRRRDGCARRDDTRPDEGTTANRGLDDCFAIPEHKRDAMVGVHSLSSIPRSRGVDHDDCIRGEAAARRGRPEL